MTATLHTDGPDVIDFIETFCTLNKSFAGQPFLPLPWMKEVVNEIFEVDAITRTRCVSEYLLGIPRKNAKSTLIAALAVYLLVADPHEPEPEIVIAAGDKDQARIVFDYCKGIVKADPHLDAMCRPFYNEIHCAATGGKIKVVSADAKLKHGLNASVVIIDEYHVHKNEDLYTALTSGFGARRHPLTLIITTAGFDLETPLGRMYERARRIESGEETDATFGFRWFGPKPGETFDPADRTIWERYNPSWVFLNHQDMEDRYIRLSENDFIRYRLNGWTSTQNTWFKMGTWEACEKEVRPLEAGDRIVFGFDGSASGDCTAIVGCRIDDLHVEKLAIWEKPRDDQNWRVPVNRVIDRMYELAEEYSPAEIGCDPYIWKRELQLMAEGDDARDPLPIVEVNTAAKAFAADTQIFRNAVLDQQLSHDGDPQLARHVANTQYKPDRYGNNRITKDFRSSTRHIDLTVASVIAVSRAQLFRETVKPKEARMIVI